MPRDPRLRKQHPKLKNCIPFESRGVETQFRVQIVKFVTKHLLRTEPLFMRKEPECTLLLTENYDEIVWEENRGE